MNSFTPADNDLYQTNEEVISSGEICYYNQPVAIVVAETRHLAHFATKLVEVKYRNISKPVIDIQEAKKNNKRVKLVFESIAKDKGNDVAEVIKGSNTMYGQYHFMMELLSCVSKPSEEGLVVHATSQWMDGMQLMISRALKIECNRYKLCIIF